MVTLLEKNQAKLIYAGLHRKAGRLPVGTNPPKAEKSADQLREEEAELLTIAMRLSQAVFRVGNSTISYDSYPQRNDAIGYAQQCQEDLQEWMRRCLGKA